ncbi:MAG: protein phosphatase [Acidimicrobiia bacterium]|nr:protein phosphatase [Acidimicrobiia bacterium]
MSERWAEGPGIVVMPNGVRIRGRGLHSPTRFEDPDYGVYLLRRRPTGISWPHDWIRWPDYWLPTNRTDAVHTLLATLERAERERVEVACKAGRGRTGTALAVMAIGAGVAPEDAVEWVRRNYDPRAIETPWQRRWISRLRLPYGCNFR